MYESILRTPDVAVIESEGHIYKQTDFSGSFVKNDIKLEVKKEEDCLRILLTAGQSPVSYLRLRWHLDKSMEGRILGDAFERGYGDLGWNGLVPYQPLYWYFLINKETCTAGYGVKVRPKALCFWMADSYGVTLWMDVRNGGEGVLLKGRTLEAACVVWEEYQGMSAFEAAQSFCRRMCQDPILPAAPVYGANNWYYAYGKSSAGEILTDTKNLVELCGSVKNKPYMVIDDCWQKGRYHKDGSFEEMYNGGPWLPNDKFPDMKELTGQICECGAIPGIWVRFLQDRSPEIPKEWLLRRDLLDPSHPEVLEHIRQDIKRICDWGFRLIKHDFSTVDIFDKWGWQMHPFATDDGWHFYDRGKTSAEIVTELYRVILEAAKPYGTLILGCNTIGHLGAGLMHMHRTGDDTSGLLWERTMRIGVNTLAFRMPQHGTFFDVDADCIGITPKIPWEMNRQWGELLAKSGTSMFVSLMPGSLTPEQTKELSLYLQENSVSRPAAVPVDWQNTLLPQTWKFEDETKNFSWYDPEGLNIPWNSGDVWAKV